MVRFINRIRKRVRIMKAKISIEIFDNTSMSQLEEVGLSAKFLKLLYEEAFKNLLVEMCEGGALHSLSVEIEDNTVQ